MSDGSNAASRLTFTITVDIHKSLMRGNQREPRIASNRRIAHLSAFARLDLRELTNALRKSGYARVASDVVRDLPGGQIDGHLIVGGFRIGSVNGGMVFDAQLPRVGDEP
ncbi:hypothetical protein QFZ99_007022 [Paraburkholderia atlantica]|uniref:hypothetical protein n=1 Tax=Paraburkholderia atlantica TaxID=2654982 RepID=UPI003D206FF0